MVQSHAPTGSRDAAKHNGCCHEAVVNIVSVNSGAHSATKWDATFVDHQMEQCYFAEAWEETCRTFWKDGVLLAMFVTASACASVAVLGRRDLIVLHTTVLAQLMLSLLVIYGSSGVDRNRKASVSSIFIFALPIVNSNISMMPDSIPRMTGVRIQDTKAIATHMIVVAVGSIDMA